MKSVSSFLVSLIALTSLSISVSPVHAAIDAPRAFVVEGGGTMYSLHLLWVNPDSADLDHINVYLSTLPLTEFGLVGTASGVQAQPDQKGEYTLSGLSYLRGTTNYYYLYLIAVDKSGNESNPTITLKRQTGISQDLTAPVDVSNASVAATSSTLQLSWTNPGDDDFYRVAIYRSTSSAVVATTENRMVYKVALPSTVVSWTDYGLSPETTYYYRLVTEDTKGNQSESIVVSGTTLAQTTAPAEPETPANEPNVEPETPPAVLPNPALFDYRASWVSQSGIINDAGTAHVITASAGETVSLELTLKNTGRAWWYFDTEDNAHEVKLGTWHEQDRTSNFKATSWLSSNRVVALSKIVPTGSETTFSFNITVPSNTPLGTYREYFRPVAEYVKWFGPGGIFWEIIIS